MIQNLETPRKLVPSRTSKWKPCCVLELRLVVNLLFKKCCVMGGEINDPRIGQTEKQETRTRSLVLRKESNRVIHYISLYAFQDLHLPVKCNAKIGLVAV